MARLLFSVALEVAKFLGDVKRDGISETLAAALDISPPCEIHV